MAGRYTYNPINENTIRVVRDDGTSEIMETRRWYELLSTGRLPAEPQYIPFYTLYGNCESYHRRTRNRLLSAQYMGDGIVRVFNNQTGAIDNMGYDVFMNTYSPRGSLKITSNCLDLANINEIREAVKNEQRVKKEKLERMWIGGTYYVIGEDDSSRLHTVPRGDLAVRYSKSRKTVTVINRGTNDRYEIPLNDFVETYILPYFDPSTNRINPDNPYALDDDQAVYFYRYFSMELRDRREREERDRREREEYAGVRVDPREVQKAREGLAKLGIKNKRECRRWVAQNHPDKGVVLPPGSPSISDVSGWCTTLKDAGEANFTFRKKKASRK